MITSRAADLILEASRTKAGQLGIAVSIVVMDAGGNLKALSRMDGAWLGSIDVAIKKAKTSALFEMETQTVWQFASPNGPAHGIESTNGGLATFAGGIPLRSDEGNILGAIGISGGTVDQDYEIAQAGISGLALDKSR
jgi:uncharacterized protein GlcG (DUF336 family)